MIAPEKILPTVIILALIISIFFYVLMFIAAVSALPVAILSDHDAAFALIVQQNSEIPVPVFSLISLTAILNGALV